MAQSIMEQCGVVGSVAVGWGQHGLGERSHHGMIAKTAIVALHLKAH